METEAAWTERKLECKIKYQIIVVRPENQLQKMRKLIA